MCASSTLAGESIDREEPAGTATGFGPVMTWFDSTLPNQRAREANEELHRTFNSETVGSNPTARTNTSTW
jgi:hypothetical protein